MNKGIITLLFLSILTTMNVSSAMDSGILKHTKKIESESELKVKILRNKVGEFGVKCPNAQQELIPYDMQYQIATLMLKDFFNEASVNLRDCIVVTPPSSNEIASTLISPNGQQLVVTRFEGDYVDVCSMATGQIQHRLDGNKIKLIFITSDNKYVITGQANGVAKIWSMKTGTLQHTLGEPSDRFISLIATSPANDKVITVSKPLVSNTSSVISMIKIWGIQTGDCLDEFLLDRCCESIIFTSSGEHIAIESCDFEINIWDITKKQKIDTFSGRLAHVIDVPLQNTYQIIFVDNNVIKIWDRVTGQSSVLSGDKKKSIKAMRVSTDKKTLLMLDYAECIEKIDIATGEVLSRYPFKPGNMDTKLLHDGKKILRKPSHTTMEVWDTATESLLYRLQGNESQIVRPVLDTYCAHLIAVTYEQKIKIWPFNPKALAWLKNEMLPLQANLIARAYKAKELGEAFLIKLCATHQKSITDDAMIWTSFPNFIRNYLNLYLPIKLSY